MLGVGSHVAGIDGGNADQRLKLAPVDGRVGMGAAGAVCHFLQRKSLARVGAGSGHGEGRIEQRRRGRGVGVAVGRIGAHDARRQSFVGRVEHAVAEANAGLARCADEFVQPSGAAGGWRPGNADARRKVVARRGQRIGHAGIAGKHQALRRAGKYLRLLALHQRLQLVELLQPRADAIPAHAVIHRQLVRCFPTVLRKRRHVKVAVVETRRLALRVARRHAEQKIGKVQARLRAVEGEAAVEDHVGMRVDLVGVHLAAELQAVLADDARERVADLVDVLGLHQRRGVHAHGEVVEGDVFNAFGGRLQRDDVR